MYLLLAIFLSLGINTNAYSPWSYNGTTPFLQNLLIGRCYQYQIIDSIEREDDMQVHVNCTTDLWNLFKKAFERKDACNTTITEDDYKPVIKRVANTKQLRDKVII